MTLRLKSASVFIAAMKSSKFMGVSIAQDGSVV
jgi:hypothetical protein